MNRRTVTVGAVLGLALLLAAIVGVSRLLDGQQEAVISESQARAIVSRPGVCGTFNGVAPQVFVLSLQYQIVDARDQTGRVLYPQGGSFWTQLFRPHEFWVAQLSAPPQGSLLSYKGHVVLDARNGRVLFCGGSAVGSGSALPRGPVHP